MNLPSFFCFWGNHLYTCLCFQYKNNAFYYLSLRDFLINLNDSCYVLADIKKNSYLCTS